MLLPAARMSIPSTNTFATCAGEVGNLIGSRLHRLQWHKEALKKRLAAENEFTELKKGIDTAYKENMDLDVKADLLIEQIVRLRDIYEVERMELQRRVHDGAENTVLMNNHRDLNIDNFLEEVRCQYEDIVQRSKEEVDARCRGKHEELHTMCGRHYEHMHNNHQEIQELTHHILMLKMEIGNLKKKVRLLALFDSFKILSETDWDLGHFI
uniref:Uncharacterized protein n=1 Tax=Sphaerodactylus townsendi TaxID=933632 RepID=A0ACB8EMJ8_9SAUR